MAIPNTINNLLDSESIGENGRYYFLDIRVTADRQRYLSITRSDRLPDESGYQRKRIVLFENDLFFFVEALSMLLTRMTAAETLMN
jgi:DNA repair protein RadC